jgi:hypothetical protein
MANFMGSLFSNWLGGDSSNNNQDQVWQNLDEPYNEQGPANYGFWNEFYTPDPNFQVGDGYNTQTANPSLMGGTQSGGSLLDTLAGMNPVSQQPQAQSNGFSGILDLLKKLKSGSWMLGSGR